MSMVSEGVELREERGICVQPEQTENDVEKRNRKKKKKRRRWLTKQGVVHKTVTQ